MAALEGARTNRRNVVRSWGAEKKGAQRSRYRFPPSLLYICLFFPSCRLRGWGERYVFLFILFILYHYAV